MSKTKYPRASVLEHRERLADDAKEALARALAARESREHGKARAEREAAEANAARATVRAEEALRLARGELHGSDLARQGAWEVRARAEAEEHALRIKDAEARLAEARAEERAALDLVANRKADVDVLVKDRERFLMEARKRAEAREEEAAAEAHRPVKV